MGKCLRSDFRDPRQSGSGAGKHQPRGRRLSETFPFSGSGDDQCDAAVTYARRYAKLALEEAEKCTDPVRKMELLVIAQNCANVPERARTASMKHVSPSLSHR